jgi:hypothetical protein
MSIEPYQFKGGIWNGFYSQGGKKKDLYFQISFSFGSYQDEGTISGAGRDEVLGEFKISGKCSRKAPYPATFSFHFFALSENFEFEGWRETEKGGFFGNYTSSHHSGTFAFHPCKDIPPGLELTLKSGANKQVRNQLLAMGFDEWLVDQALKEETDLEPALNWIMRHSTEGGKKKKTDVSDEALQGNVEQIIALGFSEDLARDALLNTGNNLQAAIDFLLGN